LKYQKILNGYIRIYPKYNAVVTVSKSLETFLRTFNVQIELRRSNYQVVKSSA